MRVIGTAGHVDHGKSTLVQALTGTHPDRLKEEREREMTIDLGFAWLTLPGGEEVGIIDVPGHRDFIENMLSGVGGIDAALFVVAADEGVMPQTREHLAILDLLQIQGGVVALTKTDLVPDPEWLDLVEDDLRTALAGTVLAEAPLVRVSARARTGLPAVLVALEACLAGRPPRPDSGKPRLPIDRVFTMPGFGTIVTGTLTDGQFRTGDEVAVLPQGVRARIRGLQTHNQKETSALPGSRTAINLSGVSLEQVARGNWVALPGSFAPTRRLDLHFRLLPDVSQPLEHNLEVKFFLGAAEVVGRLRLMGVEALQPGESGWVQLELRDPVIALRGDRYILRRPSPSETLGGGFVVDPHPKGRHKRFSETVLAGLQALSRGTPAEIFSQALAALGPAPLHEVARRAALPETDLPGVIASLLASGTLVPLEEGALTPASSTLVASRAHWERFAEQVTGEVAACHRASPLRRGIPREELKSRLRLQPRLFLALAQKLTVAGRLAGDKTLVWAPGFAIQFSAAQQQAAENYLARLAAAPYASPSVKESEAELGAEVYAALLDLEMLVQVSPEVVFRKEDYAHLVAETVRMLEQQGEIRVAELRDRFGTSRKYALAFLEHLDAAGLTVRAGDVRRLYRRERGK